MLLPDIPYAFGAFFDTFVVETFAVEIKQQKISGRRPEYRTSPIRDESQEADGNDIVAAHAIVGAGEVDGGDGIRASEGKEGSMLEKETCRGNLHETEV
jgi:hypothetical protein